MAEPIKNQESADWPDVVLSFQGVKNAPVFESERDQLGRLADDPLAD